MINYFLEGAVPLGFFKDTYSETFELFVKPICDHVRNNEFLYKVLAIHTHNENKMFCFFALAQAEYFIDRHDADRQVACHGVNTVKFILINRKNRESINFYVPPSQFGITIIPN
mgnify:CR=1 FL=1